MQRETFSWGIFKTATPASQQTANTMSVRSISKCRLQQILLVVLLKYLYFEFCAFVAEIADKILDFSAMRKTFASGHQNAGHDATQT